MFGPIVNRFLGAERQDKSDIARIGRPDDMDTGSARELDGEGANAARGPMNDDRFAALELRFLEHGLPRGDGHDRGRRRRNVGNIVRLQGEPAGVRDRGLGVSAGKTTIRRAEDPLPDCESRNPFPNGVDHAREICAER